MPFRDIYGHEKQIAILQKTIAQSRVGHAYLFSGINAVGKKTLAGVFAAALNCDHTATLHDSCGNCPSCRKMRHRSHPDAISIEADGQFIRINAIRELQEQMKFKPLEGRWRTVIIDDADKMNDQAANALLKTLEEPSASNILILISSRPYSLPATIISRCRQMRFNPLSAAAVARFLVECKEIEEQKALVLAGLAGGSIGKALELDQEEVAAERAKIMNLLINTRHDDPISLLNFASFFSRDKKRARHALDIVNSCFRDALVFKETRKKEMLLNQDRADYIMELAQRLPGEKIIENIFLIEKARERTEQNINKALTLETMAFKLNY